MAHGPLLALCFVLLVTFDITDAALISCPGGGCESKCLAGCDGNCELDMFVQYSPCSYGCMVDGVYSYNMEPDLINCGTNKVCYQGQCRAFRYSERCSFLYGPNYVGLEDQYNTCSYTCIPVAGGCNDIYIEDVPDRSTCFVQTSNELGACYGCVCVSATGQRSSVVSGPALALGGPENSATPRGYDCFAQAIVESSGVSNFNPYGQVANFLSWTPAAVGADPANASQKQAVANAAAAGGTTQAQRDARLEAARATRQGAAFPQAGAYGPGAGAITQAQAEATAKASGSDVENFNVRNANGMLTSGTVTERDTAGGRSLTESEVSRFGGGGSFVSSYSSAAAGSNSFRSAPFASYGGLNGGQFGNFAPMAFPAPGFGGAPLFDASGASRGSSFAGAGATSSSQGIANSSGSGGATADATSSAAAAANGAQQAAGGASSASSADGTVDRATPGAASTANGAIRRR